MRPSAPVRPALLLDEDSPKTYGKMRQKQGIDEEEALKKGMEEKSREFTEKGSELYAKA